MDKRKKSLIIVAIPLAILAILIALAAIGYKIYTKPGSLTIKRSFPGITESTKKPILIAIKKRNIASPQESSAVPEAFDLAKAVTNDYYYLVNGVYLEKIHKSGKQVGSIFLGYWKSTEVRGIAVDNQENVYIGKADKYFKGELAFYKNFRIEVYNSTSGQLIKKIPMPKNAINDLTIVNGKIFLNNSYVNFDHYKVFIFTFDGKLINSFSPPKREFIYPQFYVDNKENIYIFYGYVKGLRILKVNSEGQNLSEKTFNSGRALDSSVISAPLGIDRRSNVYFLTEYKPKGSRKGKLLIYKYSYNNKSLSSKEFSFKTMAKEPIPSIISDEGIIFFIKTFNKYKLFKVYTIAID